MVRLFGLAVLAFVVLKLTGVIGWSWWWLAIPFGVAALVALGYFASWVLDKKGIR